jgi:electron transfer flavoprotein beta subunit
VRIVVLLKEVPDTYGERTLDLETGIVERNGSERVLDEIGERALEAALSYADRHPGTEVEVLSMASEAASATIRKALAIGASRAVQVVDTALVGADLGLTAEVLAAALRHNGFDLAIAGNQSTDGTGGVLPAMIAELLNVPHLTNVDSVEIAEQAVAGERASDAGTMRISAELPAIVSITERMPEARFPNFKGIMAAKKKPLDTVSLVDLDVDPEDPKAARSIMLAIAERPPRAGGTMIVDEGDAGEKLAEYLIQNRLV